MNKKTLPSLLPLCFAMMVSRQAMALGLGEAELDSYLGRPLLARIPILSAKGLDAEQMNISVKPAWDAGSESALSNLEASRISIVKEINPNGEGVIYLRSELPLSEPFLDFVLSVRWPTGSLQREYTLLLDIPPSLPVVARSAQASSSFQSALPASPRAAVSPSVKTSGPSTSASREINTAAEHYMTVRGDSLWSIASRLRAARGGNQASLMAQIYALNPQAFIRGNKNLLKERVQLDVGAARLSAQGIDSAPNSDATVESSSAVPTTTPDAKSQANFAVKADTVSASQANNNSAEGLSSEELPLVEKLDAVNGEIQAVSANIEQMTARLETLQLRLEALQTQYQALGVVETSGVASAEGEAGIQDIVAGQPELAESGSIFVDDPALVVEDSAVEVLAQNSAESAVLASVQDDVLVDQDNAVAAGAVDAPVASAAESDSSNRIWLYGLVFAVIAGLILFSRRRKQDAIHYDAMPAADGKAVPPANAREDFEDVFTGLSPTRLNVVASAGQTQDGAAALSQTDELSQQIREMELNSDLDELVFDDIALDEPLDLSAGEELNLDELLVDVERGEDNIWSIQELRTQGAACVKLEDWEGAQRLFEKALALDEDNQDTRMELLDVYAHLADVAAFESLALQAEFSGADEGTLKEIDLMRVAMQERENYSGSLRGKYN